MGRMLPYSNHAASKNGGIIGTTNTISALASRAYPN
jgi:hypothetical protein